MNLPLEILARRTESRHARRAQKPHIAIIGGGVSGLVAAYRLAQNTGYHIDLYEASDRMGGRIHTHRAGFGEGHSTELGGEWLDPHHRSVMTIARKLGLTIENIKQHRDKEGMEDLFICSKHVHAPEDFIDPKTGEGAYSALAKYIEKDRIKASQNPEYAKQLDAMSVEKYLDEAAKKTHTQSWVSDAIKVAYKGEFGAEARDLSALLVVEQIGVDCKKPFAVYGYHQNETHRVQGGNEMLIDALRKKLSKCTNVHMHTGHPLKKISYDKDAKQPIALGFEGKEKHFDYAISAIPFTKLREIEGLDSLPLSPEKKEAIHDLGYGNITKIMRELDEKAWEKLKALGSNGRLWTDDPYLQSTWLTSVGKEKNGKVIFTILVSGDQAKGEGALGKIMKGCTDELARLIDMKPEEVFKDGNSFQMWGKHPWSRGSYIAPKPGQLLGMLPHNGRAELDGHLGFIGEHTDVEQFGYINGAVRSAIRETDRLKARLGRQMTANRQAALAS